MAILMWLVQVLVGAVIGYGFAALCNRVIERFQYPTDYDLAVMRVVS